MDLNKGSIRIPTITKIKILSPYSVKESIQGK